MAPARALSYTFTLCTVRERVCLAKFLLSRCLKEPTTSTDLSQITFAVGSIRLLTLLHYALFHSRFCFSLVFSPAFLIHVGIKNMSENVRKTKENYPTREKREKNARKCFYIRLCVG